MNENTKKMTKEEWLDKAIKFESEGREGMMERCLDKALQVENEENSQKAQK